MIQADHLPEEINGNKNKFPRRGPAKKLDSELVSNMLKKTGGNKAKAAKLLGIGRVTLYRFLNDHPEVIPDGC